MKKPVKLLLWLKNDKGQGLIDCGLIAGVIAIVVILALSALGGGYIVNFSDINTTLGIHP